MSNGGDTKRFSEYENDQSSGAYNGNNINGKGKAAERERARKIRKQREEQQRKDQDERRRKQEIEKKRREAEASGKKISKATVKVDRNIGEYSIGSKRSASKGWGKALTIYRPSANGWKKVSANP